LQAAINAEHVEDHEVDNENQLVITSGEAAENVTKAYVGYSQPSLTKYSAIKSTSQNQQEAPIDDYE